MLATRDAPGAVWRSSFGELACMVPLGLLSPADTAEVLRAAGLDEVQAAWVNRFVRGHPLSLQLAASAIRERPDAPEDAVLPTVAGSSPRSTSTGSTLARARRSTRPACCAA